MTFRDLTITDKPVVEQALRFLYDEKSNTCFASLFIWKHLFGYQVCTENGITILRGSVMENGERVFYFVPAITDSTKTTDDILSTLHQLQQDAQEQGQELFFCLPSLRFLPMMRSVFPDYELYYNRNESEYFYLRKDLAKLKGNHYRHKRTLIHQFTSKYPYTVADITAMDWDECMALYHHWKDTHDGAGNYLNGEKDALNTAFQYFDALGIQGQCIRVDGKMVAFNIGSRASESVFEEFFEKADPAYRGVFAFVNQQVAMHLPESMTYINREEDLGLKNLRTAKLLYRPIELVHTYKFRKMPNPTPITLRDGTAQDVHFIANCVLMSVGAYQEGGDRPEEYVHFDEVCATPGTLYHFSHAIVAECAGQPVGCIIAYPGDHYDEARAKTLAIEGWSKEQIAATCSAMETGAGEYYLDSMAILPEARGKGLGLMLVKAQMDRGRSMGYSVFSLIVAKSHPQLRAYYEQLGFRMTEELFFLGEQYDKGYLTYTITSN